MPAKVISKWHTEANSVIGSTFIDLKKSRVGRKILVTGGCGYKGSVLVPKLLALGHSVTVFDTQWFGNNLPAHPNLSLFLGDIREFPRDLLLGVDTLIHLASIANDPCGDLNPKLTWEVNALATMRLADAAQRAGVRQLIFASSGSVYGVKEEPQVTEELELTPISEYNKSKMLAERVLLSYGDSMIINIVRPATVCGYSPRMRFDVSVNMLTMQALTNGKITLFGGDQLRPNIHIDDVADLYLHFLDHGKDYPGIYNAGFENLSLRQIAEAVVRYADADIIVVGANDPRSYRINSDKLLATGFRPRHTVDDAIKDLVERYRTGQLRDSDTCYNVKWMTKNALAQVV